MFVILSSDPTFTVDNVTRVIEKMESEHREILWKNLLSLSIGSIFEVIQQRYSPEERESVRVDIYVNCNPRSSWEHLAKELYYHQQDIALGEIKFYLPPRGEFIFLN